jgi:predicted SprT family Zn-dependent metalloprotease
MRLPESEPDWQCYKEGQLFFQFGVDREGGTRSPSALVINGGEAAVFSASSSERPIHLRSRDLALEFKARELLRQLGAGKLAREVRVEWNPRLKTCAGRADYRERLISLNPLLLNFDDRLALNESVAEKLDRFNRSSLSKAASAPASESQRDGTVCDKIDRTLRHELAHLLAQWRVGRRRIAPHGAEWRRACRDLGIADEARCHNLPFAAKVYPPRYVYRCPNCKQEFPRVRRIRRAIACLACCRAHNRGEFDPRFRLRLISEK